MPSKKWNDYFQFAYYQTYTIPRVIFSDQKVRWSLYLLCWRFHVWIWTRWQSQWRSQVPVSFHCIRIYITKFYNNISFMWKVLLPSWLAPQWSTSRLSVPIFCFSIGTVSADQCCLFVYWRDLYLRSVNPLQKMIYLIVCVEYFHVGDVKSYSA